MAERARRELEGAVHGVLLWGGGAAALLLLTAVVLSLVERRPLPDQGLRLHQIWRSLLHGRPDGFAGLGILVLVLTPVGRVLGSLAVFAHLGDRRYVGYTAAVFALMLAGFLLGHG